MSAPPKDRKEIGFRDKMIRYENVERTAKQRCGSSQRNFRFGIAQLAIFLLGQQRRNEIGTGKTRGVLSDELIIDTSFAGDGPAHLVPQCPFIRPFYDLHMQLSPYRGYTLEIGPWHPVWKILNCLEAWGVSEHRVCK